MNPWFYIDGLKVVHAGKMTLKAAKIFEAKYNKFLYTREGLEMLIDTIDQVMGSVQEPPKNRLTGIGG